MGVLLNYPKFMALDDNGVPLIGGKVHTYIAGTTTNKATYSDRSLSTANANPVVLDRRGEAVIYGSGTYKVVLKDSNSNTIWTMDNLTMEPIDSANYYPDPLEADQAAISTGGSIKDILVSIGTSKKATITLLHNGVGNTTTYTINQNADWSDYKNVTFKIMPGAVISHGAFTLNIPNRSMGGAIFQWLSGTGRVTFSGMVAGVYPDEFAENTTPNTTDMTAAILAAIASGRRDGTGKLISVNVLLLDQIYSFTTLPLEDDITSFYLGSAAGSINAQLRQNNDAVDGIVLGASFNDGSIENIRINTKNGTGNGWAIKGDYLNASGVRNLVLNNVSISGFLKGLKVTGGVKISVTGTGNWAGRGSAVAGGIGLYLGEDAASSLNMANIEAPYITAFETNIHNKYCTNLWLSSPILGTSVTALKTEAGVTYVKNGYFESNTTAIDNTVGGSVFGDWTLNGSGNAMNISGTHRFARDGYAFARIVAYRDSGGSLTGGPTIVVFNKEDDDTEANFNTTTGVFTASFAGFYQINAQVGFSATATGQSVTIQLYKNGVLVPYSDNTSHSSLVATLSTNLSRLIWLAIGDTIDIRATTSAAMNYVTNACRLDISSMGQ